MAAGFTGSVRGGRALFDAVDRRPRPIPFYGELGSLNPVMVTPGAAGARTDEVAEGLAASFTMGAGQFCTKPGVVFIPADSRLDAVLAELVDPREFTMLNDRIASGFRDRLAEVTRVPEVRVVTGETATAEDGAVVAGPIVLTTTVEAVLDDPKVLLDEVFGPVTLLVRYDSAEQVREALRAAPGSLTTTLYAQDGEDVRGLLDEMTQLSGRVLYGGWPTGVAVAWAQQHGGPYPASTSLHTSVGTTAIRRFLRPVAYNHARRAAAGSAAEGQPVDIPRRVDGRFEYDEEFAEASQTLDAAALVVSVRRGGVGDEDDDQSRESQRHVAVAPSQPLRCRGLAQPVRDRRAERPGDDIREPEGEDRIPAQPEIPDRGDHDDQREDDGGEEVPQVERVGEHVAGGRPEGEGGDHGGPVERLTARVVDAVDREGPLGSVPRHEDDGQSGCEEGCEK